MHNFLYFNGLRLETIIKPALERLILSHIANIYLFNCKLFIAKMSIDLFNTKNLKIINWTQLDFEIYRKSKSCPVNLSNKLTKIIDIMS
jgi:hypothetical protein